MHHREDLHDNQLEGIQHVHDTPRCALWMPMGGGKTVVTLTALDDLSFVEEVWPALVLAPIRVARTVWPDEPAQWSHLSHLTVSPLLGTPRQRERALATKAHLYTINYDNLGWLRECLGSDWPFRTIVADEFTRLAGFRIRQGSKRAGKLRDVAHAATNRFIGLTGTPAPNGLAKLWGQTWFLDEGERLGRTYSAFEERWFTRGWDGYSLQPMPHAQKEIEGLLKDLCLTVTGLQVDEPIVTPIYVDLPQSARSLYRDMEKAMFMELAGHEVEAFNAAAKTSVCHQLANGACIVGEKGEWEEVHRSKIEALDSIIEEAAGMPVLVAYNFKSDLARLKKAFPHGKEIGTGADVIRDWNEGKVPLLFAHSAAAGHGINLARGGNILAFFSINWNLEDHMQIIERLGPMRQKQAGLDRPVYLYPILARGTIDEVIAERLVSKRSVQDLLLEAMKRRA